MLLSTFNLWLESSNHSFTDEFSFSAQDNGDRARFRHSAYYRDGASRVSRNRSDPAWMTARVVFKPGSGQASNPDLNADAT